MKYSLIALLVIYAGIVLAENKKGLLIVAHGSPATAWNQPVLNIENQVKELLDARDLNGFDEVRVALMEFAEPSINTAISEMDSKNITEVYVIPLFIAPSGHSIKDLPTILGLYFDTDYYQTIRDEGIEMVDSKIKISMGPTLNYNNVLKEIVMEQVKSVSENTENEALVLLAHGDTEYSDEWEHFINETGSYITGKTGISYYDKAFVGIGQKFGALGVEPILKAAEQKEKVIVAGVYLSMDAKTMATTSGYVMMGRTFEAKDRFEGKNIHFIDEAILPDKRIAEWIVERGIEWLER